ncbi:dihydroorotase [Methanobrevibacter millerae]|uniref:Dihydroorotase n=1 Tax=Methanobrevibacter millerae TaxID=230361 RepID=A0A1G5WU01_9EURY|nr:dihydroorotase family protein [Methanobrevibacter millerae]SDA61641.1 dihydroorotase [Methanobrevibacter millerae]
MYDLLIKNSRLSEKSGEYNIAVDNGKIVEITREKVKADKTIDIKSNYLLPGFIDPHVHFRDPGLTQKEDFRTGSEAAAHGGFTTVIDMPNTLPKTNTYNALKEKMEIASKKSAVNFYLQAGHNELSEMKKMMELNPISFKVFMDLETDESLAEIFHNLGVLMQESDYNGLVATHCEKRSIVQEESKRLEDSNEPIDYSYARPYTSEDKSVKQTIELARKNNLRLHICHLSSKSALNIARQNNISYEFTPHHLLLDNSAFEKYGTMVKTNPPLRPIDKSVRIKDIDENSIIGTDHAPHTLEDKQKGVFTSSPGIPNLETVASLLLTQVNKGNLKFELIEKILSANAAKVFGLKSKGEIKVGNDADFTVVDLKKTGKFDISTFKTKAEYSPFDGWEYEGAPVMTIVNGNVVYDDL